MKTKILTIIKLILIIIISAIFMLYAFIGAVLQESYKLAPLTEEEKMMEVYDGK